MEKLSRILHDLDQGNINVKLAKQQIIDLFDIVNRFKDPIDICIIPDVYEVMKNYRNNHLKNQQMKLVGSCKVIKTILTNCIEIKQ